MIGKTIILRASGIRSAYIIRVTEFNEEVIRGSYGCVHPDGEIADRQPLIGSWQTSRVTSIEVLSE